MSDRKDQLARQNTDDYEPVPYELDARLLPIKDKYKLTDEEFLFATLYRGNPTQAAHDLEAISQRFAYVQDPWLRSIKVAKYGKWIAKKPNVAEAMQHVLQVMATNIVMVRAEAEAILSDIARNSEDGWLRVAAISKLKEMRGWEPMHAEGGQTIEVKDPYAEQKHDDEEEAEIVEIGRKAG